MLNVTYKPFMLSVVILNVVMLSVAAPLKHLLPLLQMLIDLKTANIIGGATSFLKSNFSNDFFTKHLTKNFIIGALSLTKLNLKIHDTAKR
jgi:hypothetical protein